ncbi:ABC transporter permease [Microlunatus soli]|uniref:Ribose transport system permease protein n=1 Tax=Microlunatus soli TaxID=630515 RepID=A0A1H1Q0I6_9ACTN|nr:ABC transporter permease [Microlunatus soli]SDS16920.1 ribose transport system permease protein [Microlunatus soli]
MAIKINKMDQPNNAGSSGERRDAEAAGGVRPTVRRLLPRSYLVLVLLAMIIVGFIASPDFLTARNVGNVVSTSAIVAVLAVGQFFVIVTGGIDLSVGSVMALSTVVTALLLRAGVPAGVAVLITLGGCALVGLCNGLSVVWLRIAPFIATLATMIAIEGLSYVIQSTNLISIDNQAFVTVFHDGHLLGVPNPVTIFVLVTLVAAYVARFSTFGRRLYAIGGNREAARLSGLPVSRDLLITYTLSGALAGLAGLLAAAQLLQGSSLIGQGEELSAIAAVVVGGASLAGGRGDPISAVLGTFVITIITNIMNLVGISSQPQLMIQGVVIILAVFLSSAGGVGRISAAVRSLGRHRRSTVREGAAA